VVENGLDLEAGLEGALEEARRSGVPVLTAADAVRSGAEGSPRATGDPHLWMDPLAMRDVARALAPRLEAELGLDLGRRPERLAARLERASADVARALAPIPVARRTLVTGHDSLGYFAARYGLRVVGAVIPSRSTQAEVSAGQLADLRDVIAAEGAPAVFTEVGTPSDVAEAVAREAGVEVVELPTVTLPADGSYPTFVREVGARVAAGLGAG
jgi:zinc/manganese transport system substrate-binding protein